MFPAPFLYPYVQQGAEGDGPPRNQILSIMRENYLFRLTALLSAALLLFSQNLRAENIHREIEGISYWLDVDNKTATVSSCSSDKTECLIPETISVDNAVFMVTSIMVGAFDNSRSLVSVSIPKTVTSLPDMSFMYCDALASIDVAAENPLFASFKGVLYDKSMRKILTVPASIPEVTIPATAEDIDGLLNETFDKLAEINVEKENTSYSSIDGVIYNKAITELLRFPPRKKALTVPETVTTFRFLSFSTSDIESLVIPASVSELGSSCFFYCDAMTEITVDEANAHYASFDGVLYDKSKQLLIYCPGAKESVSFPEGVSNIGDQAFYRCRQLESIDIPQSVRTIGTTAFGECGMLKTINLPNGLEEIPSYMFSDCYSLEAIEIPNSVRVIGEGVFTECGCLTSFRFPKDVMKVSSGIFGGCRNLRSVVLGENVREVGTAVFNLCDRLKDIWCMAPEPPTTNSATFQAFSPETCALHVPTGKVEDYSLAYGWNKFGTIDDHVVGVEVVTADGADTSEASAYYNALGVESATPWNGLNIIRYADGTTRKVFF